ncbi:phosphatidylserine decarboxylase family protein [Metarhizium acridum CQMa 102]|uniref:Phosphatidylserine decarboxylase family protein n=1 Tax=Metarhizium acridum (strain CQMa 102) TaxID=655827 RepID=E9DR59_METAQ|nr:phosphatidylserine decarboxylase family protein [Metarhizium acridum CQMa 102]EFY93737.1 phosphatidylserine decarboxylase family protein [Metarhizium acridum CQMa 102]
MAPVTSVPYRHGGWLPKNRVIMIDWLKHLVKEIDKRREPLTLPNEVDDLRKLIESRPDLRMLASAMLSEVPNKEPYLSDPVGNKQIRDVDHLLQLFGVVMTTKAPEWSQKGYDVGLIGFPFNTVLDWPMATPSGYAFFLKPEVNEKMRAILNAWRDELLMTSDSQYVITTKENMWLSQPALEAIEKDTNVDGKDRKFAELFICDPKGDPVHWGFKSWDDFFVRQFRDIDVLRPIASPKQPEILANACESKPYARQTNVQRRDDFWLKGQPYSLSEMLDGHSWTEDFVGGTVYQATEVIRGTYFSEPTITGFYDGNTPDPAAPDQAQGYITHVAARAIFFIEAEPPVGRVCLIFVGMADVSSCEILKKFKTGKPTRVEKGEQIGMFHHGGSTHCVLFRKGVKIDFVPGADPATAKKNLMLRAKLGTVTEI